MIDAWIAAIIAALKPLGLNYAFVLDATERTAFLHGLVVTLQLCALTIPCSLLAPRMRPFRPSYAVATRSIALPAQLTAGSGTRGGSWRCPSHRLSKPVAHTSQSTPPPAKIRRPSSVASASASPVRGASKLHK